MSFPLSDGWLVFIGTTIVAWGTWITRRSFGTLTRAEHDAICQSHHRQNTERLDGIIDRLDDAEKSRGELLTAVGILKDRSDREEKRLESLWPRGAA